MKDKLLYSDNRKRRKILINYNEEDKAKEKENKEKKIRNGK